ncbi:ATP-binding protein [Nocardiopsis sp. CNR-923]|uniref:ATP-binding protein n=1 Tax=Nocardiopsis sp. CNR-923 TaxID=1904965 RepID=UPI0021CC9BA3|nr:ATP-binding protein [Nocardiopsis sp. CNR-923]
MANAPENVADTARLLLSERATNSVQHSPARRGQRGGFHVHAFFFHGWLRVEVRDRNGRPPTLRTVSPDVMAEGGRGLVLVYALASRWGRFRSILGPGMFFELRWDVPEPLAMVRRRGGNGDRVDRATGEPRGPGGSGSTASRPPTGGSVRNGPP